MEFLKNWIMPPVMGAIIGYFTNWLAIKMLFRPLKPITWGGITLPFTPGILPRERNRLARSIGDTVATELLTPDVFRSRLEDPAFKNRIERSIFELEDHFLSAKISPLLSGWSGSGGSEAAPAGLPASERINLGRMAVECLGHAAKSPELGAALRDAFAETISRAAAMPLGEVLPLPDARRILDFAIDQASSDAGRLEASIGAETTALVVPFRILPPDALDPIAAYFARSLHHALAPTLQSLLEKPGIRARLEQLANEVVRSAIEKLGPIQRLIVTAANYEKTLRDNMPRTIDELVASLLQMIESPEVEAKLSQAAQAYLRERGESVLGLFASSSGGAASFGDGSLGDALTDMVRLVASDREKVQERFKSWYDSVAPLPLGNLFPSMGARRPSRDSNPSLAISSLIENPLAGILGSEFISSLAARWEGMSVGQVLGIDEEKRKALAAALAGEVTSALASQAERLIEALDVKAMVVERIDALDMAEIERIILGVVDRELMWITILGGVLGAVIGVFQSLLTLL